jgi:DnaJ homolog subfamily A member 2
MFVTDDIKCIPGEGMPSQRHHEPGDLVIKFAIKFPDSISPDVIPMLERALPPRKPIEKFAKSTLLEEVGLVDADVQQQRRAQGGDAMDEDEDGGEGEPRVQCANQ